MARQKLVTRDVLDRLPPLYSMDGRDPRDVKVPVKFFNPCGAGTWFATEYDPEARTFFGFVDVHEGELSFFGLDELEQFRGPLGVGIERDLYWNESMSLADVIAGRVR